MRATCAALLLACSSAYADGVDLIGPPATPSAKEATRAEQLRRRGAVSVTHVQINAAALNSTVINVKIDDKSFRLVGAMTAEGVWVGQTADKSGSAFLQSNRKGGVVGSLQLAGRAYNVGGSVLSEHPKTSTKE